MKATPVQPLPTKEEVLPPKPKGKAAARYLELDDSQAQTEFIEKCLQFIAVAESKSTKPMFSTQDTFRSDPQELLQIMQKELNNRKDMEARLPSVFARLSGAFMPWEDPVTDANKVCFYKRNGLPLVRKGCSVRYPAQTRVYAASAIWNFGGDELRLRVMLEEGIMQLAMSFLTEEDEQLQASGVNILWGFLEFEDVEQKAVEEGLIDLLLPLLEKNATAGHDDLLLGALGNLQSCSINPKCHKIMIEKGVVELLARIIPFDDASFMTLHKYVKVVALGGLMLHVEETKRMKAAKVLDQIALFMMAFAPSGIAADEKQHGFVWSFMKPFYQLTLSHHPVVQELGAFCLAALSEKASNRQMMIRENLVDRFLCLSWSKNPTVKKHMAAVLRLFKRHNQPQQQQQPQQPQQPQQKEQQPFPPPALVEICIFTLRNSIFRKAVKASVLAMLPGTLADRIKEFRKIKQA